MNDLSNAATVDASTPTDAFIPRSPGAIRGIVRRWLGEQGVSYLFDQDEWRLNRNPPARCARIVPLASSTDTNCIFTARRTPNTIRMRWYRDGVKTEDTNEDLQTICNEVAAYPGQVVNSDQYEALAA